MVKLFVESATCFLTDWLEKHFDSRAGGVAARIWFFAHNNRLYGWAIS